MSELQVKVLKVVGGLVVFVILAIAMFQYGRGLANDQRAAAREPEPPSATAPLDAVWSKMDSGERFEFCAEARAAGYTVVVNEWADASETRREATWWLEDRCG